MSKPNIDVYPVGILSDWKQRNIRPFSGTFKTVQRHIANRNWRALRSHFNGYLAEVSYSDIRHYQCGRGWTHRAALSSLGRHLGEVNRNDH